MSIFTSINEHDYEFEARIIKDKFGAIGGEDYLNGEWSIMELKPRPGNNDYNGCKIFNMCSVVEYFRAKCPYAGEHNNDMLINFIKHEFERYNIRTIDYPWFVESKLVKIVTLYIIPQPMWKTMHIDFLCLVHPPSDNIICKI